jgi:translocation and assembly module TamB
VVLGRVNINQGTAVFNGTKYRLERGDITFSNPLTIDPIMNIEASTRISGYDITLGFHGSPSRGLQTSYRSDPPLPSSDIIALLAFRSCPPNSEFGCTPTAAEQLGGPSVQANTNVTQAASNQILGEALNATLSNRVQKLFGVSRIRIDPEVGTATVSPGTRITIEQQVSNNLTVTYTRDISQFAQQIFEVEYNLGRNVSIIAVQDQYGVLSLDVRVRRRKR